MNNSSIFALRRTGAGAIALVGTIVGAAGAIAQRPTLSRAVRDFVSVDTSIVALTHVRVIDGTGAAPRTDQTLIIRDGNIAAIGPAASTPAPAGAQIGRASCRERV